MADFPNRQFSRIISPNLGIPDFADGLSHLMPIEDLYVMVSPRCIMVR
jgi:hypothetical protein